MCLWKKIIAILLLVVCLGKQSLAQDECELVLIQATEEFNAGHLYGISAMLKDCLDKNQKREWRQRAYLLLAETYLLLEDPLGAEQSYLSVLRANPEFLTDPKLDPIDLVYLSGKFTSSPIFSLHGYAGPSISPVRIIHDVRIGGESYTRERYAIRVGWQVGVGMDFHYNDFISASAGVAVSRTGFKHSTTDLFGLDKDIVEFIDRQTWANLPVSVKYSQSIGKFRRYGYVGISFNYLLGDNANVDLKNREAKTSDNAEPPEFPKSISNVDILKSRERLNAAFFLGGGVKYKNKLDYFYLDLRYSFGMKNVVNANSRFNSTTEGLPYPYVDDDFRMDNLALSIGYIHPLYKPRKLKKARTKSVLRKIQKEDNAKN
ncbi:MAG: PorT family protein [Cyclobacteriaceae bacterium]|nr:PorT family protein [Cyclobacteriaceae bacterium]